MPQFEFYSFPEQNFYLLTSFCIVYFLVVFCYLPYTAEILKMRKKLVKYYSIKNLSTKKINLVGLFYDAYFNKK